MRFNQKELAYIACNTDIPFDKEGILWLREKEGYFIKNEVYTERWFRLKGNILFYFKSKDKASEPAGAIVLERCKVTKQPTQSMKHAFNITFDEDETQYHMSGKTSKETDEWIEKIGTSSYEGLRNRLSSLRRQLMDITGKDPLPESHPLAQQEPLKPGRGEYSCSNTPSNPDEAPLLEMCIACSGLKCSEERLPNTFVEIRTMTPPSASWTKHAQTEIIENKSDPYFLTTVVFPSNGTIQDVTRLKLAVFDVLDREKEEMTILGQAVCTITDITSAPDQKLTLTLTCIDSSSACGTVVILGWQSEPDVRSRSLTQDSVESQDSCLGVRRNSSGKSMRYIDQIMTRSYRFPTTEHGRVLKVVELMGESTLAFKIPIQLLKIYIAEEHQKALELHHLGDLNPDWDAARHAVIENHFKLIFIYKNFLRDLVPLQENTFKASKHKGHKQLPFIPVNLHLQRLRVNDGVCESKAYDIITVGAPVCHTLKFNQGGLRKMILQLKKEQHIEAEAEPRVAKLKQQRATLERLKLQINQLCERLKKSIKSASIQNILDSLTSISDKTNQLLKLREAPLVTDSLISLEKVVPRPHEEESTESAEWQWNVTAFSKNKAQELSNLVQQTLLVMQAHINGMVQGARPPTGQQWNEVILGEIHDLSRAADGLAKEIYLGLVFAQLQEVSKHVMLRYSIKRRHDIAFAHAVTSLVAGFISKMYLNLDNPQFWKQILEIGFLAQFESLLSTNGDEMGMLEDMCVAIQSLTRVKFKIRTCEKDDEIPALSGNRTSITVNIPVQHGSFQSLPDEVQEGRAIKVIPVMFSQGINEHATLAEKFGDTSLQEYINGDNFSILNFYVQQFKEKFPNLCGPRFQDDLSLDNLIDNLKVDVEGHKSKNVDIFLHSEQICFRMNGARFTSCKSAKDRTAMAVSLEQALILQREHHMDPSVFQQSIDAMRSNGTRIENTKKNTGTRKYAFNYWQVMALPRLYRPPPGTYGKNDS